MLPTLWIPVPPWPLGLPWACFSEIHFPFTLFSISHTSLFYSTHAFVILFLLQYSLPPKYLFLTFQPGSSIPLTFYHRSLHLVRNSKVLVCFSVFLFSPDCPGLWGHWLGPGRLFYRVIFASGFGKVCFPEMVSNEFIYLKGVIVLCECTCTVFLSRRWAPLLHSFFQWVNTPCSLLSVGPGLNTETHIRVGHHCSLKDHPVCCGTM